MSGSAKTLRARLNLEGLEDRLNPSSFLSNGDLYVVGGNASDTATVRYETWYGTGYYKVTENGYNTWYYASSVWGNDVLFYGYAGNDYFSNSTSLRTTAYGHDDNDTLVGGSSHDRLFGGNGSDALYGQAGNDWLEAGSAAEYADGGAGTDWNAHVWAIDGTWTTDVRQSGTGTCVFLSSLASASRTLYLENHISYLGNYTYAVWLYNPARGGWVSQNVYFDGSIVGSSNGFRVDPYEAVEGESWTILMQRAYLSQFYGVNPLNGDQVGAFPGEYNGNQAILALTGQSTWTTNVFDFATIQARLAAGQTLNVCSAVNNSGHCYALVGAWTDSAGNRFVTVYNPWATDQNPNSLPGLADGADDGYITMRWSDFTRWFSIYSHSN